MRLTMYVLYAALTYPYRIVAVSSAETACTSLRHSLGGRVVQFHAFQNETSPSAAWNLFNAEYSPTCAVFALNAVDVQTAMKTIYSAGVHYSVRAGGHSAMVGWNSVEEGVLIDLVYMNETSYDPVTDSLTLQPGVLWDQAVSATQALGIAPVGGRQGDVGTALMLGGGFSFLSPAYGFAADSYKELDVVLITGELVTATETNEYSDLFRALKGGGNRFGIVTRYELYPVHTGTVNDKTWYGGSIVYPVSSAYDVLNATAHYVRDITDPKAVLLVDVVYEIDAGVMTAALVGVNLFYNGSFLPSSIFGEFLSISSGTQTLGPLSYVDITNILPSGNQRGLGQHYGASALVGDEDLYLKAFEHFNNFTNTFMSEFSLSVLAFTPVLQPQIDAGRERGGNAVNPPDGSYAAVQLSQQFAPGVLSISDEVQEGINLLFEQVPRSTGKPLFMNECDKYQNVYETYGNYEELKQTYKKYDPTRFIVGHMDGPIGL